MGLLTDIFGYGGIAEALEDVIDSGKDLINEGKDAYNATKASFLPDDVYSYSDLENSENE